MVREAMRADHEFLHRLEEAASRVADSVVLVVHTVDVR